MNTTDNSVGPTSVENDSGPSNSSNILWELNEKERSLYSGCLIFVVIIMLVGIIGNLLVLIIYKNKFKRTSARVYILSLAMADLSVCVIGLPYHILDLTYILTYDMTYTCKALSFLIGACTISSVFILLVVGLDRYLKVCRPLKRQIIDFGDRKACLIAVFAALVVSIPNGLLYGGSTVKTDVGNVTGVECFIDDEFQDSELAVGYFGFNLLLFVLSVLYLIIIYGFICRKIYKHDRDSGEIALRTGKRVCCCRVPEKDEDDVNETEMTDRNMEMVKMNTEGGNACGTDANQSVAKPSDKAATPIVKHAQKKNCASGATMIRHRVPGAKANEKNTRKITLMMLTITVVFIISYLPFIIMSILDVLDPTLWIGLSKHSAIAFEILLRIYLINNAANPIIYGFWDARFRAETVNLIKKILCIATVPESTTVTKSVMHSTLNTSSNCCTENTLK